MYSMHVCKFYNQGTSANPWTYTGLCSGQNINSRLCLPVLLSLAVYTWKTNGEWVESLICVIMPAVNHVLTEYTIFGRLSIFSATHGESLWHFPLICHENCRVCFAVFKVLRCLSKNCYSMIGANIGVIDVRSECTRTRIGVSVMTS